MAAFSANRAHSTLQSRGHSCGGFLAPRVSYASQRPTVTVHALDDFIKGVKRFFDVNDKTWAPKSTRIWRLSEYEFPDDKPSAEPTAEDVVNDLEARVNQLPASARPAVPDTANAISGSVGALTEASDNTKSFSDAEDSELAWALNRRIAQIATASVAPEGGAESPSASEDEDDEALQPEVPVAPLTAEEMRQLIFEKYNKTYDVSFVRRDIPGKTFVCLNIMWTHLEQRSFNLTEEQYMQKLDGVVYILNALEQTDKVRAFLKAPRRSQKGLPPRPVVGTAISIQLDLDRNVIDEWFGRGYQ